MKQPSILDGEMIPLTVGGKPVTAPDIISVPEAAKRLGIAANTLRNWIASESPPEFVIRIGQHWRVSVPRLESYLHGSQVPTH